LIWEAIDCILRRGSTDGGRRMLLISALLPVLANALIERHPERAADVLERVDAAQTSALFVRADPRCAAQVLRQLSPGRAAHVVEALPAADAAALLDTLALDTVARLLRTLESGVVERLLAHADARRARMLRVALRYPEHTAGALMDPGVLALPASLTVADALERFREEPENAHYNLYVIDAEHHLVGAFNLRELFLAPAETRLDELMIRSPFSVRTDADRATVVSHPGWRAVHSLPVVDPDGRFVGALRYRTLRELEEAMLQRSHADASSAAALGDLFATGAAALLDALAAPVAGGARRE
jgi:magnesium transporter